MQEQKNLDKLV